MDEYVTREGVVDPEVRAYIYSLVTAVRGFLLHELPLLIDLGRRIWF